MKSYIKIYGPPVLKSLRALQAIAIETPEVCIMDTVMAQELPKLGTADAIMDFFSHAGEITVERCDNIISESGGALGEYDFFFEWFVEPSQDQLNDLIEKVDEALGPLGARYTITTKED